MKIEMVHGGHAVLCPHGDPWRPKTHFWHQKEDVIYAKCKDQAILYVLVASVEDVPSKDLNKKLNSLFGITRSTKGA